MKKPKIQVPLSYDAETESELITRLARRNLTVEFTEQAVPGAPAMSLHQPALPGQKLLLKVGPAVEQELDRAYGCGPAHAQSLFMRDIGAAMDHADDYIGKAKSGVSSKVLLAELRRAERARQAAQPA